MDNKQYLFSEKLAVFRSLPLNMINTKEITSGAFSVLMILYHTKDNLRAIDLSKYFHCSKVYIGSIISNLEHKGLIVKEQSKDDKREFYLHLTSEAKKLVNKKMDEYMNMTNYLYNVLGDIKVTTLISLIDESITIINKYQKEIKK